MQSSDIRKVIGSSILADGMSPIIDLEKSLTESEPCPSR